MVALRMQYDTVVGRQWMILMMISWFLGVIIATSTAFIIPQSLLLTPPSSLSLTTPFTTITTTTTTTTFTSRRYMGLLDGVGEFLKRFTTKATASHILIKGGAEAQHKLEDLKMEIDNSPIKFATAATQFSECPSGASSGGSLGEFGPGTMVPEFDTVVFKEDVGKVHGPIKTQFGYHLIYITDRTE